MYGGEGLTLGKSGPLSTDSGRAPEPVSSRHTKSVACLDFVDPEAAADVVGGQHPSGGFDQAIEFIAGKLDPFVEDRFDLEAVL